MHSKSVSLSGIIFSIMFTFCASVGVSQTPDTLYQNKIREYTTDSRFLPESVSKIVDSPNVPSPLGFFGSIIGAPGIIHHTSEIYGYYKALAKASPSLKMEQVGTSEEGRPIYLVSIADAATITTLGHYREILAQLSDPRKTDKAVATKLIVEGKPVYYLNGSMHSTEMGSPETLMELAYRLITDPSPGIRDILSKVIVLINPVSEPDGRDKQVDWYYRYSKSRTEWDDGFPKAAPYWGKYVYHDNNRDGIQITQEITKALYKIYFEWHPTIMLDLHESIPLMYISTGTGPYNEHVDPITIGEWQTFANEEMTSMAAQGLPGVFDWAYYDGWWPGYGIWLGNTHNSIGRFYETFGNAGANTYLRDLTRSRFSGDPVTSRQWYRPEPATGKVVWSLRDNINYTEAGILASLKYTAANGTMLLQDFYQKGVNNINFGENHDVKMFDIPAAQRDPVMAAYLVNQLRKQGIEVYKVNKDKVENQEEYVVLLDQPYSSLACDLLSKQEYPKEAKFPPYDEIAWTLGYMYGVDVKAEDSIRYQKSELTPVTEDVSYAGTVTGDGQDYVLKYRAQYPVISALYGAGAKYKKFRAFVLDSTLTTNSDTLKPGTIILKGLSRNQAADLNAQYGIDLIAENPDLQFTHQVTLPRIAVYHSWYDTQEEGWVRFTLEQKNIPYTSIDKDDLKAGALRNKFDVIIIPNQGGDLSSFINGNDTRFGPMPYTKTAEFPSHGTPDATNDMTGGPGFDGLNNLNQFVKDGGVLVPLDNSAAIIADAGIGREVSSFSPSGLFHPGSIVTVKARNPNSPILYGFPEIFHIFKGNGILLETEKYDRHLMVLQYGTKPLKDEEQYKGKILGMPAEKKSVPTGENTKKTKTEKKEPDYVLSGMVRNEEEIIGNGVIFNVPHGKGRVVFFTSNPLNRYLNLYDSSLLWNTLINWDHL